jgi:serine/threonine protein kinase
MEIYCSRPGCAQPRNQFPTLDSNSIKHSALGQLFCQTCGMPLILDGRYVIEKPLAKGGFGITYLARDRRTPAMKKCVVKQLVLHGFDAEQTRLAKELFHREGTVLEELGTHPQIPELLAFFELDVDGESFFYLVQEYIDGLTLETLIKDFGPLPPNDVIDILQNLLPVLQFIHDRNAIHRDIKPANIMVHRHTQVYYLLDFGAVKQVKSITAPPNSRSTGIFTPGYAAPEQLKSGAIYPATDIYGLGATCIFLLTGKDPEDLDIANYNWRNYAPKVPDQLARIIDKMTAYRLKDRYQSAQAVLADLSTLTPPAVQSCSGRSAGSGGVFYPCPVRWRWKSVNQPPTKASWATNLARSINQIPLQSYILSGFSFGVQLGVWGALAVGKGFGLMGVIPSLLLLSGLLLGLLFLRAQNILDNKDMLASTIVTFVVVLFLKAIFRFALPSLMDLIAIGLIVGFGTVALLSIFRLLNQVLRQLL